MFSSWCRCSPGPEKGPRGDTLYHVSRTSSHALRCAARAPQQAAPLQPQRYPQDKHPGSSPLLGCPVGGDAAWSPAAPFPSEAVSPEGKLWLPSKTRLRRVHWLGGPQKRAAAREGRPSQRNPPCPISNPPGRGPPGNMPAGEQGEDCEKVLRTTFGEARGSLSPYWQRPGTKSQAVPAIRATCRGRAPTGQFPVGT